MDDLDSSGGGKGGIGGTVGFRILNVDSMAGGSSFRVLSGAAWWKREV